jgi:hypothetical protein
VEGDDKEEAEVEEEEEDAREGPEEVCEREMEERE